MAFCNRCGNSKQRTSTVCDSHFVWCESHCRRACRARSGVKAVLLRSGSACKTALVFGAVPGLTRRIVALPRALAQAKCVPHHDGLASASADWMAPPPPVQSDVFGQFVLHNTNH